MHLLASSNISICGEIQVSKQEPKLSLSDILMGARELGISALDFLIEFWVLYPPPGTSSLKPTSPYQCRGKVQFLHLNCPFIYILHQLDRSGHFIDPLLRAILETSLTPDDNDLFMTNITRKPILVIHGFVLT